jgi:aspartyl-tRNA(Asn)/glutamyl-tRNA(Gln) amidotransferase subunit A
LRRGALGSHLRQFMQGFDLIATPAVAVPAFEARPAGHSAMSPEAMLGWTQIGRAHV